MADSNLTNRARRLRSQHTNAEGRLWHALRNRRLGGWKFRRQVLQGPYIVDFLCAEARLVVEVDGPTHGDNRAIDHDARRTAYLESLGLRVFRVTNNGVFESLNGACDAILAALGGEAPHLASPRQNGERNREVVLCPKPPPKLWSRLPPSWSGRTD